MKLILLKMDILGPNHRSTESSFVNRTQGCLVLWWLSLCRLYWIRLTNVSSTVAGDVSLNVFKPDDWFEEAPPNLEYRWWMLLLLYGLLLGNTSATTWNWSLANGTLSHLTRYCQFADIWDIRTSQYEPTLSGTFYLFYPFYQTMWSTCSAKWTIKILILN